jgi:transposase/DNA-binding CsgD family transcriptional regulator
MGKRGGAEISENHPAGLLSEIRSMHSTAGLAPAGLRRLNAVATVLSGGKIRTAADEAGVAVRTVRRWLRALERHGLAGLLKPETQGGRPAILEAQINSGLSGDLERVPTALGHSSQKWSGALVAKHLKTKFQVDISERQARRLLKKLTTNAVATVRPGPTHRKGLSETPQGRSPRKWISDAHNKEVALRRIKRLANAGLPVEPYVMSLFELMNDAVPSSSNKSFLPNSGEQPAAALGSTRDVYDQIANHQRLIVDAPFNTLQIRAPFNFAGLQGFYVRQPVWRMDEWTLPEYRRTDGFNVVFAGLGWYDVATLIFAENGRVFGCYPVGRGKDQRPFSRDDLTFFRACAPHVAHGLRNAQLLTYRGREPDGFLPLALWGTGVVLMDSAGSVMAIDDESRSIFASMGVLDGVSIYAFEGRIREGLAYVHRLVMSVFHDDELITKAPVVRLVSHWTGITLKLRGSLARSNEGREIVSVLVERGETPSHRRMRMMARWGLGDREYQIISALGTNEPRREIAGRLGIRSDTLKTYGKRIADKLELGGISELRRFASQQQF